MENLVTQLTKYQEQLKILHDLQKIISSNQMLINKRNSQIDELLKQNQKLQNCLQDSLIHNQHLIQQLQESS